MFEKYRIQPSQPVRLDECDPNGTDFYSGDKDSAKELFEQLNRELEQLQELLYAEHKHRLLIVLQATDTGGKDGVIRHVFEGVNPQGVRVANFKVPTALELDHDYLWRVHQQVPGKGEIVIFNRSHYEDVLVVRVHNLVEAKIWKRRYQHICDFEKMLTDEGVTILKFYLHIDLDEQKERLLERLNEPAKLWKFNPGDLDERKLWDEYMMAYSVCLSKTSTNWAPWFIVPSNKKWYRNLVISKIVVDTLKNLDMTPPKSLSSAEVELYRQKLTSNE